MRSRVFLRSLRRLICTRSFNATRELVKIFGPDYAFLQEDPTWAAVYAPNGTLAVAGQKLYRPTLANTLEKIAKNGPDVFYQGPIANRTIAAIKARGGIMTLNDLKRAFSRSPLERTSTCPLTGYKAVIRKSPSIKYRNYTIHSAPAPASGVVALSAMNMWVSEPPTDVRVAETPTAVFRATRSATAAT